MARRGPGADSGGGEAGTGADSGGGEAGKELTAAVARRGSRRADSGGGEAGAGS